MDEDQWTLGGAFLLQRSSIPGRARRTVGDFELAYRRLG
jgi:hypothetical protein